MKTLEELQNTPHLCIEGRMGGGLGKYRVFAGWVNWEDLRFTGSVIFGFDEAGLMEHVSVCPNHRTKTPSWEVMCRLKDMFFKKDEMVVQIHPAEENYLHGIGFGKDRRENILHLWRPKNGNFEVLNRPEEWQ